MAPMPALKPYLSVEDYLEDEREGDIRHEYGAGEAYAMAGASDRHGLLAMALGATLLPHARKKRCQLFMADMKVRIDDRGESFFYYPDLLLACDAEDRESAYYRRRPCLIVEIASPSTWRIDRTEKLAAYRSLHSLREYVLVHQNVRQIEVFRYPQNTHHIYGEGVFRLECLEMDVAVDDVYADADAALDQLQAK
ncbi:MAG: Uma2 family endonuclease [Pseudomonadota bacterium]